jgi:hypothetical protein
MRYPAPLTPVRSRGLTQFLCWLGAFIPTAYLSAPARTYSPLNPAAAAFHVWPIVCAAAGIVIPVAVPARLGYLEDTSIRSIRLIRSLIAIAYATALLVLTLAAMSRLTGAADVVVRNTCLGIAAGFVLSVGVPATVSWAPLVIYLTSVFLLGHPTVGPPSMWALPVLAQATHTQVAMAVMALPAAVVLYTAFGAHSDRRQNVEA